MFRRPGYPTQVSEMRGNHDPNLLGKGLLLNCRSCQTWYVTSSCTAIALYHLPGELGWEIHHNRRDTGLLYRKILEAGEEFEIGDYGSFATNSLRLEKGFRGWGAEVKLFLTIQYFPVVVGGTTRNVYIVFYVTRGRQV